MPAECGTGVILSVNTPINLNVKNKTRRGSFAVCESGQIYKMPDFVTAESFQTLLKEIDTFIFDADGNLLNRFFLILKKMFKLKLKLMNKNFKINILGVLWLGEDAIPGSPAFIDYLINKKKQIIILTNNATKSRAVYAKKLKKLGYSDCINKVKLLSKFNIFINFSKIL